ncbi:MAG TPA: stage II sporulation protein M [Anaerolineales bacterium]|nr:stage II sporulation protein M [Anaerolineales bacterium]
MRLDPRRLSLSARRIAIVIRREIRDQFRDWRIFTPIVILTVVFPSLMTFTAERMIAYVNSTGGTLDSERLAPFLMMVVGFFPISVSLALALESFVGEKERLTLEPLLATPLSDLELFVGKALASMLTPIVSSQLGILVYLGGVYAQTGWLPAPGLYLQIALLAVVQAAVMVSAAVVISSQVTSVRAANLLASFVIIPFAMLIQGLAVLMLWGELNLLWWIMLGLAAVLTGLWRMGVRLFRREELLGRELDQLDLRAGWRFFAEAFRGERRAGEGFGGWYRREVLGAVARTRLPIGVMAVVLLVGTGVGYAEAAQYRLPEALTRDVAFGDVASRFDETGISSLSGAIWIFLNNVRAIGLASLAGMASWGVLALLLLMLPLGIAGFLSGQLASFGVNGAVFFSAFVLPHGIFEIPAALIAGGAILRMSTSFLAPPPGRSIGEAWLLSVADWARIYLLVVVPLLFLAALAEAFVTPQVVVAVLGR